MPRAEKSRTFINFINKKYRKQLNLSPTAVKFYYYDDYACWLFYKRCKEDYEDYYIKLEEDFREYSDLQTGAEKDE